jgi:serine/threonine protein kinase
MVRKGRYSHRFYTKSGHLYERTSNQSHEGSSVQGSGTGVEQYELLVPKKSSLRHRVPDADAGLLSFISYLLCVDPRKRPSAAEAMHHPWLQYSYASLDSMS